MCHQRYPHHHNTPNQQRRNPKHGKSVARSAPKPCTLSQQMAAAGSYGSSGGGGGRPHMGIRGPHALGSPMEPGMRGPSPVRQPGPVYQELLRKRGGGGGAVSDLIFAAPKLRVKICFWVWVFGGAGAPPPPHPEALLSVMCRDVRCAEGYALCTGCVSCCRL